MSELPHAKGGRPIFLDTAATDDLLAMVMALAQEVAVLRERCDTTERLLHAKGTLGPPKSTISAPIERSMRSAKRGDAPISSAFCSSSKPAPMRKPPAEPTTPMSAWFVRCRGVGI